jgi:hypothetical protein
MTATISMISEAMETATTPVDLSTVLADIGSNRWAGQVAKVKLAYEHGGKDAAAPHKKHLPGILFSGEFRRRSASELIQHSGLICIDLDHLGNTVGSVKEQVCADPHTLAAFVSPTGSGLKVILKCDPTKKHEESFKAAEHFMLATFGLEIDPACKDVCRICFVSHDPEIFIADDAQQIPYPPTPVEFKPTQYINGTGDGPGDEYNEKGDWQSVLLKHGWSKIGSNGWRRPEKTDGLSATWDKVPAFPKSFYCFTSSTPFTPGKVYRPFAIYAILECGGDFKLAASQLGKLGFGKQTKTLPLQQQIDADKKSEKPVIELVARPLTDFVLPPVNDPSVLIGNRYLSCGDGAILASTSGMGKSSLSIQAATTWGLGRELFGGFKPSRPLRSLIFQSEDSEGDIAEVKLSLFHAMKLNDEEKEWVMENVKIVTDRVHRGAAFINELKRQIEIHKPDLVWINPLLAFIGGDVNDAKEAGEFLREGLNSLNEPAKFAYIIVHHTSKPPKEKTDRRWNEVMYDMAGSADLTNWARAIISLRPADEEGRFNLVLAKRGRRAGFTRTIQGKVAQFSEPITTISIKHSSERFTPPNGVEMAVIHWEQCDEAPESTKPGGRPRTTKFEQFKPVFPIGLENSKGFRPLLRAAQEIKPSLSNTAFDGLIERSVDAGLVCIDKRNPLQPKYYLPVADNSKPLFVE